MHIQEYLLLPLETRRRLIKQLISETVPSGEVKATAFAAGLEDYTLYKMRDGNRETHDLLRPELPVILHHRGICGCCIGSWSFSARWPSACPGWMRPRGSWPRRSPDASMPSAGICKP